MLVLLAFRVQQELQALLASRDHLALQEQPDLEALKVLRDQPVEPELPE